MLYVSYLLGSERSPESIKTKIVRLMSSYKEAHEKLHNTGNGLHGLEFSTFQEYIIKNVCKYYYELHPVLSNRPNVYPWFTNEQTQQSTNDNDESTHAIAVTTILLSSDDDDSDNGGEVVDNATGTNQIDTRSNYEYEGVSLTNNTTSSTNISVSTSRLNTDEDNSSKLTSPSNGSHTTISSASASDTDSTKPKRVLIPKKLTPMQAKKKQRLHIKNKKSLVKKKDKDRSLATVATNREIMVETRNAKMLFEQTKHDELKGIEAAKLELEKERLQMEKDSMMLKHEQIKEQTKMEKHNMEMKEKHMKAQTSLENNKIVLLKLEIFKERQRIKKENKDVTEEYLDHHFPYPN